MIKLDGEFFASIELALPFFSSALKVEIYDEPLVASLPDAPNAKVVRYYNLPLVSALPNARRS